MEHDWLKDKVEWMKRIEMREKFGEWMPVWCMNAVQSWSGSDEKYVIKSQQGKWEAGAERDIYYF